MVNPGGPGASGIELAVGLAIQVSDKLLSHFDLVGFDPRGVGLSTPVSCISDSEKDQLNAAAPDVLTATGLAEAKHLAEMVATKCNASTGRRWPTTTPCRPRRTWTGSAARWATSR